MQMSSPVQFATTRMLFVCNPFRSLNKQHKRSLSHMILSSYRMHENNGGFIRKTDVDISLYSP